MAVVDVASCADECVDPIDADASRAQRNDASVQDSAFIGTSPGRANHIGAQVIVQRGSPT